MFRLLILYCFIGFIKNISGQHEQPLINQISSTKENYCRIPMQELIATAESATSRILQGICNPRELNERFSLLETQIVDQFNVLKTMVLNLEDKLRDQDEMVKNQHRKLHRAMATLRTLRKSPGELKKNAALKKSGVSRSSSLVGENFMYDYDEGNDNALDDGEFQDDPPSARLPEMLKFNSTIQIDAGKKVFTYYWTVRDIIYRMKNWSWRRSLRSESFYIFQYGYRMYIRIYPNQNGKNIYIHVGITQGVYDDELEWPFKLKHKIQVIDHDIPGEDLTSRVWDPTILCSGWNWRKPDPLGDNYECVGLGFPQATIISRRYLHNKSITIKLTVFLE